MTEPKLEKFEPLLAIICCPYTKTPLTLMTLPELEESLSETERKRIPNGTIGAMTSNVSSNAYPIVGPVVSFLEQDILSLSENNDMTPISEHSQASSIKQDVKKWYDEFGWKQTDAGLYGDTASFSQIGLSAHGFYEMDSHLSFLDRFLGGEFFLDAGSGAISHPEYLAYSWFYKYRVCVDISLTALQEAASKVGEKGFYCMADICRLPFRENVFDGIICGYTIQHIPESDQRQAVAELYRVLAPNKHCCIMTDLRYGAAGFVIRKACRMIRKILKQPDVESQCNGKTLSILSPAKLYGWTWNLAWWRQTVSVLDCKFSLHALRIFAKDEFENLFGNSLSMPKTLRILETSMPKLLARFCRYGLIHFSKKK